MKCKNPNRHPDDELCFCPGEERTVRQALAKPWINGWIGGRLMKQANELAADERATEEKLWEMLFWLEDNANGAYGMWRQSC
jgi:hypothetical protein